MREIAGWSSLPPETRSAIMAALDKLPAGRLVMLKLTLPEQDDLYADCIRHPNVLKVVALSGGYPREEANSRLARQHGMVASFSRALTEGLSAQQSEAEFNAMLDAAIEGIYQASITCGRGWPVDAPRAAAWLPGTGRRSPGRSPRSLGTRAAGGSDES